MSEVGPFQLIKQDNLRVIHFTEALAETINVVLYAEFDKGITVHTTNHQSFRQLSQKHVVLDVIHVVTGNRIYFDFYSSDGVFTAGHFQSFDVTLKIKLRRSRDVFALMADADNYKIKIKDLALFVRNVHLSPAVRMGHVKASLSTQPITSLFGNCPKNMLSWT
jgi:uncharacterized protein YbbC (DUF1343 family)